jgi:hypothetical protein
MTGRRQQRGQKLAVDRPALDDQRRRHRRRSSAAFATG